MCGLGTRLFLIVVSCILLWYGIRGLREDEVKEDGDEIIEHAKSPLNYWVTVVIYLGLGGAGLLFALFIG